MSSPSDWEQLSASEIAQFVLNETADETPKNHEIVIIEEGGWSILSSPGTPLPKSPVRELPLDEKTWMEILDSESLDGAFDSIRRRVHHTVHHGGVEDQIRSSVWKYMLKVEDYDTTKQVFDSSRKRWKALLELEYSTGQQSTKSFLLENLFRIEKDVIRTDRNHSFYPQTMNQSIYSPHEIVQDNEKLCQLKDILMTYSSSRDNNDQDSGFVQGMADLASMFLVVAGNEVDAYGCFCKFMETRKENFLDSGDGIKRQLELIRMLLKLIDPELDKHIQDPLFCSFRWLLVSFRREFQFQDCLKIWDQLIASYPFQDWQVFLSVALLEMYRNEILKIRQGDCQLDELMRFFQSQAMHFNVDVVLLRAEEVYLIFERHARSKGFPLSPKSNISLLTTLEQLNSI